MSEQISHELSENELAKQSLKTWFERGLLVEQPLEKRKLSIPSSVDHRCQEQLSSLESTSIPDLLKAGFFFANFVGGGERPIFSQLITLPDGTKVDCATRAFLTKNELDFIKQGTREKYKDLYEQKGVEDERQISEHMLDNIILYGQITNYIENVASNKSPLANKVDELLRTSRKLGFVEDNGTRFDIIQNLTNLRVIGGIVVKQDYFSSAGRSGGRLYGENPFLDQPWVFGKYVDYLMTLAKPVSQEENVITIKGLPVRINTVVAYLAGFGLENTDRNEREAQNQYVDGDQHYVTIGSYLESAYNFELPGSFEFNPLISNPDNTKASKEKPNLFRRVRANLSDEYELFLSDEATVVEASEFLNDVLDASKGRELQPLVLFDRWVKLVFLYRTLDKKSAKRYQKLKEKCGALIDQYTVQIFDKALGNKNGQTLFNLSVAFHFSDLANREFPGPEKARAIIEKFDTFRGTAPVLHIEGEERASVANAILNPRAQQDL